VPAEVVETAVKATASFLAELKWQENEKLRIARETEDAEWRAAFIPHAIILGDRKIPTSITMCVISGGPERWLMIELRGGGYILRPGWSGCLTLGNPVPSHAGHSTSALTSFGFFDIRDLGAVLEHDEPCRTRPVIGRSEDRRPNTTHLDPIVVTVTAASRLA
jgi:hypothetical protein